MKRSLFAIAMLVMTSVAAQAQGNNTDRDAYKHTGKTKTAYEYGELKIRSGDNTPITVTIDRTRYENADHLIHIGELMPRRYRIQVFPAGLAGRKQTRPLYDAYMHIAPSTSYYVIIDRNTGRADIKTTMRNQRENRINDRYHAYEDEVMITNRSNRDRNNKWDNSYASLTDRDFNELRIRVQGQSFSADKMNLLKTALRYERVTTAQVLLMMDWLSFETDKLELVQWAYERVADPRDYWKVESGFSFSSTKNDFYRFLNGRS